MARELGGAAITGCLAALVAVVALSPPAAAQRNDKRTHSRSQYVHHIELYDATGRKIDPSAPGAPPYSPEKTCLKCHDVKAIGHGYHFNQPDPEAPRGRAAEPWIWTDRRAGTWLPLSPRGGRFDPAAMGLSRFDLTATFGAFLPGGGVGHPPEDEAGEGRFGLSGALEIDCLICHSADREYSHERYAEQVDQQNFAHAPTAALGLGRVSGRVDKLKDDFDPRAEGASDRLPKTDYDARRFDPDGAVFFDIVREPSNDACYRCHTTRRSGVAASPRFLHDVDVHLSAGLRCVDCHRNGLDHDTVRGYEGDPAVGAETLSCRGCHMDEAGGHFGAPRPRHAGLPPLHLDTMSCTTCHAGPRPEAAATSVETSMAHRFAIPSQTRSDDDPPAIVEPVYRRDEHGVIYPYRVLWPAYFGYDQAGDGAVTPIRPDVAYAAMRKAKVRVRDDFGAEISAVKLKKEDIAAIIGEDAAARPEAEWSDADKGAVTAKEVELGRAALRESLAQVLAQLGEDAPSGATPVYVAGGRGYRRSADADVETSATDAASPVSWPIAHDVRPARQSLGSKGCIECHAPDAPFFYGEVTAVGPIPDASPITSRRFERIDQDPALLSAWELMFQGRAALKWTGVVAVACVVLVVLAFGLSFLFGGLTRSRETT